MLKVNQLIGFGGGVSAPSLTCGYITGDRTGTITVTATGLQIDGGSVDDIVDGGISPPYAFYFQDAQDVTGDTIKFNFGSGKIINEAKWYQNNTTNHGTFKWQGSNNDSDWTDIGGNFLLGNDEETSTQTELNGNTTSYQYYRMIGQSGTTSSTPWNMEIEFSECT